MILGFWGILEEGLKQNVKNLWILSPPPLDLDEGFYVFGICGDFLGVDFYAYFGHRFWEASGINLEDFGVILRSIFTYF